MVEISPAAVAEIERMQRHRKLPDSPLRIAVQSGGCLDFFYDLSFETELENSDRELKGDRLIQTQGIDLIVDRQSWKLVEELKLDYAEDLMGGGFRFYNSQIEKACGCGISFAMPSERTEK